MLWTFDGMVLSLVTSVYLPTIWTWPLVHASMTINSPSIPWSYPFIQCVAQVHILKFSVPQAVTYRISELKHVCYMSWTTTIPTKWSKAYISKRFASPPDNLRASLKHKLGSYTWYPAGGISAGLKFSFTCGETYCNLILVDICVLQFSQMKNLILTSIGFS